MLCEEFSPRNTRFFSLAAQMRMRYQAIDQRWRDDARKERDSVVFKCINISDVNIK
jgi:hypothetical protein